MQTAPLPTVDLATPHHVVVTATNTGIAMSIDGMMVVSYQAPSECGEVAIRVWGASFSFTNISITGA